MKVIHLISGGDTGGAKTHIHTLLQGLNRHIQADMVCFTDGPFTQEARDLGIHTDVLSGSPPAVLKALRDKIRQGGYDLIHCHGSRGNLMGALLKRSTGLPLVSTVHSDPRIDYMGRPLAALTFGTLNSWALRRIPNHIGVSRPMVDLLIDRGYDPQAVFDIPNGLDFSNPAAQLTRREYLDSLGLDWPDDSVIAGIAARLNPVKDMGTLLRGFALARREQPRLRLIIAGEGEEGPALRQLAQELEVADAVCFAGWVEDTDSFYHALDINTLTSLSEGFPYSLPEGARFALPTVATCVGGVPALIKHNVTGLLFQPRDHEALARCLAELAADPSLRRRLGDKLLEKAREDYSIENTVRRQLDIYETILRRRARASRRRDGVILCGAYGQNNAGDEAVLKALVAELRSIDPDMPLWVMTRKPKAARRVHRVGAVYTFNLPAFCRRMSRSVLYANGGGSLIQDVTSHRSLWFYLFTLSAARRLGCKVMMYGCGIGPIQSPRNRRRAGRIINRNVDAITLREPDSLEELKSMGVDRPDIRLTADPALTLSPAAEEKTDSVLLRAGVPPHGERYICFALRPWPGFREKAPLFGAAARYAWERYGLSPVFTAVEKGQDPAAAREAARELGDIPRYFLDDAGAAGTIIGSLSRMEIVVSMRLHALIFAAGQGIPLAGVVYDPKVSAFLRYIGQENFTDLETLTEETLRRLIDRAAARAGDKQAQAEAVRKLREMERGNVEIAKRLLG